VYKGVFRGLAILAAAVLASTALAIEPDGRVAFRYEWLDKTDGKRRHRSSGCR
jgi:hypothetical protein